VSEAWFSEHRGARYESSSNRIGFRHGSALLLGISWTLSSFDDMQHTKTHRDRKQRAFRPTVSSFVLFSICFTVVVVVEWFAMKAQKENEE